MIFIYFKPSHTTSKYDCIQIQVFVFHIIEMVTLATAFLVLTLPRFLLPVGYSGFSKYSVNWVFDGCDKQRCLCESVYVRDRVLSFRNLWISNIFNRANCFIFSTRQFLTYKYVYVILHAVYYIPIYSL